MTHRSQNMRRIAQTPTAHQIDLSWSGLVPAGECRFGSKRSSRARSGPWVICAIVRTLEGFAGRFCVVLASVTGAVGPVDGLTSLPDHGDSGMSPLSTAASRAAESSLWTLPSSQPLDLRRRAPLPTESPARMSPGF